MRYANTTDEDLILCLVYLERLLSLHNWILSPLSVHRCVATALVVASKFISDEFYNNTFYARISGLPVNELNVLEITFLQITNFNLYVSPKCFEQYETRLQDRKQLFRKSSTKFLANVTRVFINILFHNTEQIKSGRCNTYTFLESDNTNQTTF